MSRIQSSLARFAALGNEPNEQAAFEMARRAWQDHGIVLLKREWVKGPIGEWWAIEAKATAVFGKRKS